MKKILLVRLSAMGDVIHALPVISDIRSRWPGAEVSFAVDSRFAGIVSAHRDINHVISLPLKTWKNSHLDHHLLMQIGAVIKSLRHERYDAVLDLHGLIKSAVTSRLTHADHHFGPSWALCAEKLAWFAHDRHINCAPSPSPVIRMRRLAAKALDCNDSTPVDFGLTAACSSKHSIVFAHCSSRAEKLWPENHWIALGDQFQRQGYEIVLPWGTPAEQERAGRIADAIGTNANVSAWRDAANWIAEFRSSTLLVGVDTGLTHLAAACDTPCIALFSATDPALFTPNTPSRAVVLGRIGQTPEPEQVWQATQRLLQTPRSAPASKTTALPIKQAA